MSDLISRQDAIKEITVNPINESLFSADFLKGFRCGAKRQFQADAEEIAKARFGRPTGEWIDYNDGGVYYANCSNCGYQVDVKENNGYPNFCEHCGADMKGGDSE